MNRRVLVTGGAGFIGQHLVRRLSDEGNEVLVVDDLSSGSEAVGRVARLEVRDVSSDDAALGPLFRAWRPQTVFHLAAQVSVPRSMEDPERDLLVNCLGTLRVVDACVESDVAKLVFVSSGGAVYGETRSPATERSRPKPTSYYGWHKLLAEKYVASAALETAIARPSNVYGPGQHAGADGAVVAAFVQRACEGAALVIHGDGLQSRDLLHVSDAVAALQILGLPGVAGIWNVSAGEHVTVIELARLVMSLRPGLPAPVSQPRRVGDIRHSRISAGRLRRCGWFPSVSLIDGISALLATAGGASSGCL